MPAITLTLEIAGESKLALLDEEMNWAQKGDFANRLATNVEQLTRDHIIKASQTRHTTAQRLGATPTQYLLNKASSVEAVGSPGRVLLNVSGEIFKRTFQPVTVSAVNANMLTIPVAAESYGKRAGEFGKLFVYQSKGGAGPAFLARKEGGVMKFLFCLKRSVVLPQDRGLLPSEDDIIKTVEMTADEQLDVMRQTLRSVGGLLRGRGG
jgi:hypothetical protein